MTKDEKILPPINKFIVSEQWVKTIIRKGLRKKSRDFYFVTNIDRLSDGKYLIRLEKDYLQKEKRL